MLEDPGKMKRYKKEKKRERKMKKEARMASSTFTTPSVPDPTALPLKYVYL